MAPEVPAAPVGRRPATTAVGHAAADGSETFIVTDTIGPATPAQVYAALTQPELVTTWCGGTVARHGQHLSFAIPESGVTAQLISRDGDLIRYSWRHEGWVRPETDVSIRLAPVNLATTLTLTQRGLAAEDVPAAKHFWGTRFLPGLRHTLAENSVSPIRVITAEDRW
jgi:uncharacterized protein YndB with AHSA1/START domain